MTDDIIKFQIRIEILSRKEAYVFNKYRCVQSKYKQKNPYKYLIF